MYTDSRHEHTEDSKSLDLSYQVDEFKTLVTSWKKYEDELKSHVSIGVQHVRKFVVIFPPLAVRMTKPAL